MFDCLSAQLFVLNGLERHSCGPSFLLYECVSGCHLKCTGAAQSAGRRGRGVESGEGQKKKSAPVSDTKLQSGREEVGRWAVVCLFLTS